MPAAIACAPLRQELLQTNREIIQTVESQFEPLRLDQLNWKPEPRKWSMLECLHHLNLTNASYLKYASRSITRNLENPGTVETHYTPGWLGTMLYNMVAVPPDHQVKKKSKAPGFLDPAKKTTPLDQQVLRRFLENQHKIIDLLEASDKVDWTRTRVQSSLGPLIRFRLGDALRNTTCHNQRHVLQAQRLMEMPGFPK